MTFFVCLETSLHMKSFSNNLMICIQVFQTASHLCVCVCVCVCVSVYVCVHACVNMCVLACVCHINID